MVCRNVLLRSEVAEDVNLVEPVPSAILKALISSSRSSINPPPSSKDHSLLVDLFAYYHVRCKA